MIEISISLMGLIIVLSALGGMWVLSLLAGIITRR